MDELSLLFLLLVLSQSISGSTLSGEGPTQLSCPEAIVEQWDSIVTWSEDDLKLELNLDRLTGEGRNCSFHKEVEVEVFAVKNPDDSYKCDSDNLKQVMEKFFCNHYNPKYVLSETKRKVTFEFILGDLVFKIGEYCTPIKSYNKTTGNTVRSSALKKLNQCLEEQSMPEVAPNQPSWKNDICSLEIPTFQLSKCYVITDYLAASVYLVQVDDGNRTCKERGIHGELNPKWNPQWIHVEVRHDNFPINDETKIKDIVFSNLTKGTNYCIFVSMWETYPICNPGSTKKGLDPCYYFTEMSFRCPSKPLLHSKPNFLVILVVSCIITLLVCGFLLKKYKTKIWPDFSQQTSIAPLREISHSSVREKDCKIYLLYYPNDEVTDEDIQQIKDENGPFCNNLKAICTTNINVAIIDIVDKIRLDDIQDTSGIELDLSNGMAKCVLLLTPSAKRLFDYIDGGGETPNPLDQDLVDGSVRNVILPLFKYLRDFQTINVNTYETIGCVRFDRNESNDGDEIRINPLQRTSLPSEGRELAEWAIYNS